MKNIKGDAMYEVINTYSYYGRKTDENYDWGMSINYSSAEYGEIFYNDDFVLIGNILRDFLLRGGSWGNNTNTGVFVSIGHEGNENVGNGFRPVVVVL